MCNSVTLSICMLACLCVCLPDLLVCLPVLHLCVHASVCLWAQRTSCSATSMAMVNMVFALFTTAGMSAMSLATAAYKS